MGTDPLTLAAVADAIGGELLGDGSVAITDVTHDSREARPGSLYAAVRGFTVDGHRFVERAGAAGAAALVEEWCQAEIPQIKVADTRVAMARAAHEVHGRPSERLAVAGITGTNGKTTVSHLVESIVSASGRSAGRIGTLGAAIAGDSVSLPRTTPEATDLHRLLARMCDAGVDVAAIEVSSHALTLHRVGSVRFAVAAFTNLSQDHLDFHADMDEYFEAKARLFDGRAPFSVIWVDDPKGAELADRAVGEVVTVGTGADTTVRVVSADVGLTRSDLVLDIAGRRMTARVGLGGGFNVANAAVTTGIAHVLDIEPEAIAAGLAAVGPVSGRLEPVEEGQSFTVLVDYAHSPGGIEAAVAAVRGISDGTIISVVGAGGDRDVAKRPLMGAAAACADIAVLTSDNPRSEDPAAILAQVAAGADRSGTPVHLEVDREKAIGLALSLAGPGDVVLILGKGHEQGQQFADRTIPFDDREVAARLLREGVRR